ncbi:hypothetical protein CYMTET_7664 [Cymbomonas tetramitiformis]|uniref:ATP synthase mitochondrial F1 complex assembly factor 2 n=1 Tax=Cymbomonas tetramitiformis TaxID=36881 RepID=A0AAE0LH90_9CHLO|nr:hypothetical protein CYMTET_7664 [Cymbomonas tetramitiformis]
MHALGWKKLAPPVGEWKPVRNARYLQWEGTGLVCVTCFRLWAVTTGHLDAEGVCPYSCAASFAPGRAPATAPTAAPPSSDVGVAACATAGCPCKFFASIGAPATGRLRSAGQIPWGLSQKRPFSDDSESKSVDSNRIGQSLRGDGCAPRFYKQVSVGSATSGQGFTILLDGRVLKTPGRQPLELPNKALALAVAAEWEWQYGREIRPYTMPMMTLASTGIDQVPQRRDTIVGNLLKFIHTDAACCREDPSSELGKLQAKVMDPILDTVEEVLGARPLVSEAITGPVHPKEFLNALEKKLYSLNKWELACLDHLAGVGKSTVIALAALEGTLTIPETLAAMRLEEEHQISEWGLVEGTLGGGCGGCGGCGGDRVVVEREAGLEEDWGSGRENWVVMEGMVEEMGWWEGVGLAMGVERWWARRWAWW